MDSQKLSLALAILSVSAVACSSAPQQTQPDSSHTETRDAASSNRASGDIGTTTRTGGTTSVKRKVLRPDVVSRNVPTFEETRVKADINRMKAEDFVILGLPLPVAKQVIDARDEMGRFNSVDDLNRVVGVTAAWLNSNRDKLGAG